MSNELWFVSNVFSLERNYEIEIFLWDDVDHRHNDATQQRRQGHRETHRQDSLFSERAERMNRGG